MKFIRTITATIVSMGLLVSVPVFASHTENQMSINQQSQAQQIEYSAKQFAALQKSGQPFLVAFHKKGCSMCVRQQNALNQVYQDPAFKSLTVVVVNYDNDTAALRKFNVGQQGTLILFKGDKEISRTASLTNPKDIEQQIQG